MRFRILDDARKEMRSATRRYTLIRLELGIRFKNALRAAFDRIETWPRSGDKTLHLDERICRLKRFPYGVVYVSRMDEIVVLAVMHLHRRPGYWKRRMKDI